MSASLINGLFVGVLYSLFGAGIVIVYRVDRVINFAHGDIGMIGALVFITLWADHHVPLALAVVIGCSISAALAMVVSYFIIRPLRNQRPEIATLATYGFGSLLLLYAARRWGVNPLNNPPVIAGFSFKWSGVYVQNIQVLGAAVAVGLFMILLLLLGRTSFGLRVRAVALNPGAAAQVGIRTEWVSVVVWASAGILAAISGILVSSRGALTYDFMTGFMLRGLIVALLGGLTNLGGAFLGGLLLGLAEGYVGYQFIQPGAEEAFLGLVIIAVLVSRPTGLIRAQY